MRPEVRIKSFKLFEDDYYEDDYKSHSEYMNSDFTKKLADKLFKFNESKMNSLVNAIEGCLDSDINPYDLKAYINEYCNNYKAKNKRNDDIKMLMAKHLSNDVKNTELYDKMIDNIDETRS
jgi:endonuclease III-like uncharacterized protein